jgi:hypothetical protein
MRRLILLVSAGLLSAGLTPGVRADVVRLHYVPAGAGGSALALQAGEWQPWRGSSRRQPYTCPLQPTHLVTFRHPCTGALVTVPMRLPPDSQPRVEHVGDRVVFNYGSYTVEAQFFPDGSLDVLYNGGPGRRAL